jgi:four helix bundle protein
MKELKYRGFRDLIVYQKSYQLSIEISNQTKSFPIDEKYSLIDQIRRSSRSVSANIAEAWAKRQYVKAFVSKLSDCLGEASETEVWLSMSFDLGYIDKYNHDVLITKCTEVQKMLNSMIKNPEKFCCRL